MASPESATAASAALLAQASALAGAGRFAEMRRLCAQQAADLHQCEAGGATELPLTGLVANWLDLGVLLMNTGFFSDAEHAYQQAARLAPADLRAAINLASLARETGQHALARQRYADLLRLQPGQPVLRRNALVSLEYDPEASDAERLAEARAWGDWAQRCAGGDLPRPPMVARSLAARPLRVGYVSADFCQHTVGLFIKAVLQAQAAGSDAADAGLALSVYAYSAGTVDDWVTRAIRACTNFRAVAGLDDAALAQRIRADGIDVLVDLSGHTAGSRLAVFARRPAPVQVAWLGYFATTGLRCIDAVLMDRWHVPEAGESEGGAGAEAAFVEPVIRLPQGRFCYTPVPWMPAVGSLPCLNQAPGTLTFGCFNNAAKFNAGVFDLWARLLTALPAARLVLKWRSFNDADFCRQVTAAFVARGVAAERLVLRGPSFHADLLNEYHDIDIALDPFPFTGGLTSCEALWMGVPVVTWPQSRPVSRQTLALLAAIGLESLAARDADDYLRIALALAADLTALAKLRASLRARLQQSPLCNVPAFARQLAQTYTDLYDRIHAAQETAMHLPEAATAAPLPPKTVLHVGPGHRRNGAPLPPCFQGQGWRELRLDIDPANEPDLLGSMLDMAAVASGSVAAVYSAHNIEHVHAHEVPVVLGEFFRVLQADGYAVITCPDLQAVAALIANDQLTEPAYQSPAGPISPLDILYGHGAALAAGHHAMAHKCGFTLKTLTTALQAAGFQAVAGKRRARGFDLWVVATRKPCDEAYLRALAGQVLPA